MTRRKKVFYVKVEFLDGQRWHYQLPADLQKPMRLYFHEHPEDWKSLLAGALINVPVEKYSKANHYQPLIRVAHVRQVYYKYKDQYWRTRGQFLTRENWQMPGLKHFWQSSRFLRHDFNRRSQWQIIRDYASWRRRFRRAKPGEFFKTVSKD